MMIVQTIFARSNTILSDQNAFLLSYNIMEKGLMKFCSIKMIEQTNFIRSYVFLLDHMIGDRPYKLPCAHLNGLQVNVLTQAYR